MSKVKKASFENEVDCEFKGIGIGKEKLRIGVNVGRDQIDLDKADELFCGSQLQVRVDCDPNRNKDVDGQQTMEGSTITLDGVANVLGYGVKTDHYSISLQFTIGAIELNEIGKFANRKGKLFCSRIGDAPTSGGDDGEGDAEL
jgi:hypothetical protein